MVIPFEGVADGLWTAIRALPPDSRERLLEHLISDQTFRQELEDLLDLQLANERMHEPTRPLEDVLSEIER